MGTRREFLRKSRDGGALLLSFVVAGCQEQISPEEARARGATFSVLSADEVMTLDALGEVLLPGARSAGLSHYIDQQLGAPVEDQLLMLKYLGLHPPHDDFYHQGLAALDAMSRSMHSLPLHELAADQAAALVGNVATGAVEGWNGPPPPLFYFALRSDAVDVVYGTPQGFAALGIAYQAHIEPPAGWG